MRRLIHALRSLVVACVAAGVVQVPTLAGSGAISNSATGSLNGATLDPTAATVTLSLVGGGISFALAEIAPNDVLASVAAQPFVYDLLVTQGAGDPALTRVEISAPAGYSNLDATSVTVGGTALTPACPTPGAGEYCDSALGGVLTVLLGDPVTGSATPIRVALIADTPALGGIADFTSLVADGGFTVAAVAGDADGDPGDANSIQVTVYQSQGLVLRLAKSANKRQAMIGEVVTYAVEIRNTATTDVVQVRLEDLIPPNFKYVRGSARLDGAPLADPAGPRPLAFDIGTVPALVDGNSNGTADPGEPGFMILLYQLVIGSGARPGDHVNEAVAKDFCAACEISNRASARVEVQVDRDFELGTIIGKVFEDPNRDGWQDPGERGVAQAMVALDDGTYVLTDEHGRYHFPAVLPGQRAVKINVHSLPPGTQVTTERLQVLSLSPGLMARANFGVVVAYDTESIGREAAAGVELTATEHPLPVQVRGSTEAPALLVNGQRIALPGGDVQLGRGPLDDTVQFSGSRLDAPVRFQVAADSGGEIRGWRFEVYDSTGRRVRLLSGSDAPPSAIEWDGRLDDGAALVAGEVYQYQLLLEYRDGGGSASPRRLFGVNRTSVIFLDLRGDAFESGRARLSETARAALRDAAAVLARHPDDKVVIEGHTDTVGTAESNLELSRRRAQAAADYLVGDLRLPVERFVLRWFGEERPIASNEIDEGRAINRRVEVRSELADVDEAEILDRYHAAPSVRINGVPVPAGEHGTFSTRLDDPAIDRLEVELGAAEGQVVRAEVPLPRLEVLDPVGRFVLPAGGSVESSACKPIASAGAEPWMACRLSGRTDPHGVLELDGRPLEVDADGAFTDLLTVTPGRNVWGLVARNAQGVMRLHNFELTLSDRDADGGRLLVGASVPQLTVQLPPLGIKLRSTTLPLAGTTQPGNRVEINGSPVEVGPDGGFRAHVELPRGASRLVVRVTDPQGNDGTIERDVEVSKHELFLLAFADGKISQLEGRGYLEGAGLDETDELFVEGRLAFYLKGVIAGKYLITSAYDSGSAEPESLLGDLDVEENRRLLTNLDPDKYYPVYGDGSTLVYDAQSSGKFYLALDSETIHVVVGNYPLSLSDSELAAYRRTLYGGRFAYRSLSRTEFGDPDTEVVLFAADVSQEHVHDELRATGGSLYYLSRRDVIEGSEEVLLVVRDKHTGLVLGRQRQQRDVDYTIKYEEGRLLFHRPLSSVVAGGTLADPEPLEGNEVFIEADYETRIDAFEKTASGGHVRRQIGDRFALGGTVVQDEAAAGSYELGAVEAEVRLGQHSRITAEYAASEGRQAQTFHSDDGGVTYTQGPAAASSEGTAWKAAAELDLGEWFGQPERHRVTLYAKELEPGFSSSGNAREAGTQKTGVLGSFRLTERDTLQLRHEQEELESTVTQETSTSSALYEHAKQRWGVGAELFSREVEDDTLTPLGDSQLAAARFWAAPTDKLRTEVEHQQTLGDADDDRTSAALQYRALPNLALEVRGSDGDRGSSAQAGALLDVGESSIYLTERLAEDPTGSRTSTILGARSPIGPSSQVYSEYRLEDSDARGQQAMSLLGLQRVWDAAPGLRFRFSGERADVDSGTDMTRRSALGAGLSWVRADGLSLSTRGELRLDDGSTERTQVLTHNQLEYRVNPDVTVIARYRYSKTTDEDLDRVDARLQERSVGLAFRPVAHDRLNALVRYTLLSDMRPFSAAELRTSRDMQVLSVETLYQVSRRFEWFAKGALRDQEERVEDLPTVETRTGLAIQRLNYRMWRGLDLGAEYRVLVQDLADDRRTGWLTEVGWRLHENFRVGLGYNFTDFSDNEFSTNDYSVRGWFLRVQGMY